MAAVLGASWSGAAGAQAGKGGKSVEVSVVLKGAKEVEVERVPLSCRWGLTAEGGAPTRNRIHDRLAVLLAGRWRFKGADKLEVDEAGLGQVWRSVGSGMPTVIELQIEGNRTPFLFWRDETDGWFVASGALGQSAFQGSILYAYDADLDGAQLGPHDWLRVGAGSFYLAGADPLAQVGESLFAITAAKDEKAPRLVAERVALPDDVPVPVVLALTELNRWRMQAGCAPMRLNVERTRALMQHAKYVNEPGNDGDLLKEDPSKPGYTIEGDQAARGASTIAGTLEPIESVRSGFVSNYNRISSICDPEVGFAAASVRNRRPEAHSGYAGYTWLWISGRASAQLGAPRVQPAVGQTEVVTTATSEYPVSGENPDLFKKQRGTPVGAHFDGAKWTDVSLELFDPKGRTVPADVFTPARPVCPKAAPDNRGAAFLWPAAPLQPKTRYTALLLATESTPEGPRPLRFRWSFTTAAQ
jgi:hypothetical protein